MSTAKAAIDPAASALLAVGTEICRARTAAGLTQAEFAARMDMTVAGVAELEAGRRAPSVDFLHRAAEACGGRLTVHIRRRRWWLRRPRA